MDVTFVCYPGVVGHGHLQVDDPALHEFGPLDAHLPAPNNVHGPQVRDDLLLDEGQVLVEEGKHVCKILKAGQVISILTLHNN